MSETKKAVIKGSSVTNYLNESLFVLSTELNESSFVLSTELNDSLIVLGVAFERLTPLIVQGRAPPKEPP